MRIVVIDAQGAGIGQAVIKNLRKEIGRKADIIALGTNQTAALNMKISGADINLSGEKEIVHFLRSENVDAIIGPIGVILSGGINGEITEGIASALLSSSCSKYLIPLRKHGIFIPGTRGKEIKELIEEIVLEIKKTYFC